MTSVDKMSYNEIMDTYAKQIQAVELDAFRVADTAITWEEFLGQPGKEHYKFLSWAASKFKGEARWGTRFPTPILLQDHGDGVEFRNLRLRELH